MRYFAHTSSTVDSMLRVIKKNSITELFNSIPQEARLKSPLSLPSPLDEYGLKQALAPFCTPLHYTSFLGAGACEHFTPEWVSQQLMRAEWYTSYTPYQPEASQGTLQAIFEYQSMTASLFGLDIANASMYDGATALVEALLMAVRVTQKKTVILPTTIHPEYRQTVKTYCGFADLRVLELDFDAQGGTDLAVLSAKIKEIGGDLAAIAVQSPNFFGRLEQVEAFARIAHEAQALLVAVTTDVSSCALLSSFGASGADIAVGEGLGLLGALHLGGPGVGLFAARSDLLRQMPGRIVGMTKDHFGNDGFVLTLSTREQHIRREKATSNICTNHNLMALALSMVLSSYGKTGLRNLAEYNIKKTLYFRRYLNKHNITIAFAGPHYNETVVNLHNQNLLEKRLAIALKHKLIGGLTLERFYKKLSGHLLICTSELQEERDLRLLAEILAGEFDA